MSRMKQEPYTGPALKRSETKVITNVTAESVIDTFNSNGAIKVRWRVHSSSAGVALDYEDRDPYRSPYGFRSIDGAELLQAIAEGITEVLQIPVSRSEQALS